LLGPRVFTESTTLGLLSRTYTECHCVCNEWRQTHFQWEFMHFIRTQLRSRS